MDGHKIVIPQNKLFIILIKHADTVMQKYNFNKFGYPYDKLTILVFTRLHSLNANVYTEHLYWKLGIVANLHVLDIDVCTVSVLLTSGLAAGAHCKAKLVGERSDRRVKTEYTNTDPQLENAG